jgi:hypothetical protein
MAQSRRQTAFSAAAVTAPALAPPQRKPVPSQSPPAPRVAQREREAALWRVIMTMAAFVGAAIVLAYLFGCALRHYETRQLADAKKQAGQAAALLRQTELKRATALSPVEIDKLALKYNMIKVSDKETITVQ